MEDGRTHRWRGHQYEIGGGSTPATPTPATPTHQQISSPAAV